MGYKDTCSLVLMSRLFFVTPRPCALIDGTLKIYIYTQEYKIQKQIHIIVKQFHFVGN